MIPATTTIRLIDIKDNEKIVEALNNYPIYDEAYRKTLNDKIINHYAFDEIGFETPALFAHYFSVKLNEIMPKYNKLYLSEILKNEPLCNFSYKENLNKEIENSSETESGTESTTESSSDNSGESNSTSETSASNTSSDTEKHVNQQTPQGDLVQQNIENYTYATEHNFNKIDKTAESSNSITDNTTNESHNTSNASNSTTSSISNSNNTTENYIKLITGSKNLTVTSMLKEFIINFKDIDVMIIEDLESLFLQSIELL